MSISSTKLRFLVSLAVALALVAGLGARAVQTRRQARLNDFFKEFFQKKSATYEAVAKDCEGFDDDTLKEMARTNWDIAKAYARRSEYHSELSRRYWSALVRPWVILPRDAEPPPLPADQR